MDLNQFFEDLASQKPVPGGGSASCVAAAMATSLMEMVVRLSTGRGNNAKTEEKLGHILDSLGDTRSRLFTLAEEDAKGYRKVMKAYRLPKGTDGERALRKTAIQKALEGAIASPLTLMKIAVDLIGKAAFILAHGNKNAFSDAGVAFHLIKVAFEGGKMNVLINLDSLQDPSFKQACLSETDQLESLFLTEKQSIEKMILDWMYPVR